MMKTFRFRGGAHPPDYKSLAANRPLQTLPWPDQLHLALQQHVGAPAVPVVKVGQAVAKGQLLAQAQGGLSAPVHAPTSGTVQAIDDYLAAHASGLPTLTISLAVDGEDRGLAQEPLPDPLQLDPEEVAVRIGAAGIVGLGGANFPTGIKLSKARQANIHTLIINGAECEPYVSADDRLMREQAEGIVDGVALMLHALQTQQALIAIEDNKPEAVAALTEACRNYPQIAVAAVPTRYPTGSAKQLTQLLTGVEVPAQGRGTSTGVLVQNVATAYAVHRALRQGQPLLSRVVTVSGGAVAEPGNWEVPLGAPVNAVLAAAGGYREEPSRLIMNGPMMGHPLPGTEVPVVKGMAGILALTAQEIQTQDSSPCIRCGRCVSACPMGLMPVEIVKRAAVDDFKGALRFGLNDCISCGSCAYVCPSRLPLVQYLEYANGQVAEQQRMEHKVKEIRRLQEQQQARKEQEARAQAEAAARRKAERAKKKAKSTEAS